MANDNLKFETLQVHAGQEAVGKRLLLAEYMFIVLSFICSRPISAGTGIVTFSAVRGWLPVGH